MTRWRNRYWGQMYLVPVDWDPDAEDADDRIVYSFEYGRSHFKVASELWALVEDTQRAEKIENLFSVAYGRVPHLLRRSDIEWVQLFSGAFDGSDSDHLTIRRCGREGGSGSGTAPSA